MEPNEESNGGRSGETNHDEGQKDNEGVSVGDMIAGLYMLGSTLILAPMCLAAVILLAIILVGIILSVLGLV